MKQFFKALAKYLLFLLVFVLIVGQGVYYFMQSTYEKGKLVEDNYNILILGDSQFETGINPQYIPNSVSFAKSAIPHSYMYAQLKYFTEKNDFDLLLISIGYHSLYQVKNKEITIAPKQDLEQELSSRMALILNNKEFAQTYGDSIKNTLVYNKVKWMYRLGIPNKIILTDIIDNLRTGKPTLRMMHGGFFSSKGNNVSKESFNHRFSSHLEQADKPSTPEIELKTESFNPISKIIEYCQARNMKVVFINTPLHPDLIPIYEPVIQQTDSLMDELAMDENIYYLNLSQIDFPEKGFKDHNHLNDYGAEIFSKQLNDTLLKMQKNILTAD